MLNLVATPGVIIIPQTTPGPEAILLQEIVISLLINRDLWPYFFMIQPQCFPPQPVFYKNVLLCRK
jgi:hypothetical protein